MSRAVFRGFRFHSPRCVREKITHSFFYQSKTEFAGVNPHMQSNHQCIVRIAVRWCASNCIFRKLKYKKKHTKKRNWNGTENWLGFFTRCGHRCGAYPIKFMRGHRTQCRCFKRLSLCIVLVGILPIIIIYLLVNDQLYYRVKRPDVSIPQLSSLPSLVKFFSVWIRHELVPQFATDNNCV